MDKQRNGFGGECEAGAVAQGLTGALGSALSGAKSGGWDNVSTAPTQGKHPSEEFAKP